MTEKGFIVGSANGYIICYEFKNEYEPKQTFKIHISNRIKSIASMSLSRGNTSVSDDYHIAIAGVYLKPVKKSLSKQTPSYQ